MKKSTFDRVNSTTNVNIQMLLTDQRNCASPNMKEYFRTDRALRIANWLEIIRWDKDGELWFVTLGWLVKEGKEDGFAGVKVREVACFGKKATTGYPNSQTGGDYEVVTDWFWKKYWEQGMMSIPEIWHIEIPRQRTHAEAHYV